MKTILKPFSDLYPPIEMAFDESKHPRGKKGSHEGGKFVVSKGLQHVSVTSDETGHHATPHYRDNSGKVMTVPRDKGHEELASAHHEAVVLHSEAKKKAKTTEEKEHHASRIKHHFDSADKSGDQAKMHYTLEAHGWSATGPGKHGYGVRYTNKDRPDETFDTFPHGPTYTQWEHIRHLKPGSAEGEALIGIPGAKFLGGSHGNVGQYRSSKKNYAGRPGLEEHLKRLPKGKPLPLGLSLSHDNPVLADVERRTKK